MSDGHYHHVSAQDDADYWQARFIALMETMEKVLAYGFSHVSPRYCKNLQPLTNVLLEAESVVRPWRDKHSGMYVTEMKRCSKSECRRPVYTARGLCVGHYNEWLLELKGVAGD